jgi:tyrosyl-tRNA synthetase
MREAGAVQVEGEWPSLVDLLVTAGLSSSKSEARRSIAEGGVYLNNQRVEDADLTPGDDDAIGGWVVLRRGKKRFAGVERV